MAQIEQHILQIPMRDDIYNIINDIAIHRGANPPEVVECWVLDAILSKLEMELTGETVSGGIGEDLGEFLCRKYGYNPKAWREE